MRKKLTVAIITLLPFLSSQTYAQIFVPIFLPSTPQRVKYTGPKIDANYTPWSKDAINFSKFKGVRANSEQQAFQQSYTSGPKKTEKKIGNIKYRYYDNVSYLYNLKSWVKEDIDTSSIKQRCQTDFNLWELCSRKAIIDFNNQNEANLSELYDVYRNEYRRLSNSIDKRTDNGNDKLKLQEISDSISHELDILQVNPEEAVSHLNEYNGWGFTVGLEGQVPISDYVNNLYGFNISAQYLHKKNYFGFGAVLEFFGKCQRDILTSRGTIYEGEKLNSGAITLDYGYRAWNNNSLALTPFINTGVRFFDGGTPDNPKRENDTNEKVGFTIGTGIMFDVMLSKQIDIKVYSDKKPEKATRSLRLKPYFAMTNYGSQIGWTPSLNLALEYNLQIMKMK